MEATHILSSFIGAILLFICQWIWKDALPAIVLRFQKNEPRISGKWRTSFEEEGKQYTESVHLTQRGRKVCATIILREEDGEEIVYLFTGTFKNLILSGTYVSKDEANFERGAILLRYARKDKFVGQLSLFSKTSDTKLISSKYEWSRA